ncbi:hypothetical protein [Moritella viscosa]|uniref:Thymidylate kinase-dTMP kinase n=1 Tax=Moritella viscosa TaxID=80854 RepID=A0A1L0AJN9_9GAMM|nr:hypothetical protein [Moritella viscosa]SGZ16448.1 Thymidylate kinase-dTMP kinase [Moritella viscosa]SHO17779.1 Thymidylate kinase-dTMP kinase [Moritella viscosa]
MRVADRFHQLPSVIRALPYFEYKDMLAYLDKEPGGSRADAYYAARHLHLIAQVNSSGKGEQPTLEDFIPWTTQDVMPEYLQTEEEKTVTATNNNNAFMEQIEALTKQKT